MPVISKIQQYATALFSFYFLVFTPLHSLAARVQKEEKIDNKNPPTSIKWEGAGSLNGKLPYMPSNTKTLEKKKSPILSDSQMPWPWDYRKSLCDYLPVRLVPDELQLNCQDESDKFYSARGLECAASKLRSETTNESENLKFDDKGNIQTYKEIPIACIYQSMRKGVQSIGGNYWYCPMVKDKNSSFIDRVDSTPGPPVCLNNDTLQYLHWVVNQGIKCIEPGTDAEFFNAPEIFAIINHESHFIYNVDRNVGNGLMQIQAPAAIDMDDKPGRPSRSIWNSIAEKSSACEPFKDLFKENPWTFGAPSARQIYDCPYVHPYSGVKRNVIIGLLYMRNNVELAKEKIKVEWFNDRSEYVWATRYAVRIGYNRGISTLKNALDHYTPPRGHKLQAKEFLSFLRQQTRETNSYATIIDADAQDVERSSITAALEKQELLLHKLVEPEFAKKMKTEKDSQSEIFANILFSFDNPELQKIVMPNLPDENFEIWLYSKIKLLLVYEKKKGKERLKLELAEVARQLANKINEHLPDKVKPLDNAAKQVFIQALNKDNFERLRSLMKAFAEFDIRRESILKEKDKAISSQLLDQKTVTGFNCYVLDNL